MYMYVYTAYAEIFIGKIFLSVPLTHENETQEIFYTTNNWNNVIVHISINFISTYVSTAREYGSSAVVFKPIHGLPDPNTCHFPW